MEDIITEVEAQMETAADITKIISSGNLSGSINSMSGVEFSEQELEAELEELLHDPDEEAMGFTGIPVHRKPLTARSLEQPPTIEIVPVQSLHDTRQVITYMPCV